MRVYLLEELGKYEEEWDVIPGWPWLGLSDSEACRELLMNYRRSIIFSGYEHVELPPWQSLEVRVWRKSLSLPLARPHDPPADIATLCMRSFAPLTLSQRAVEVLGGLLAPDTERFPLDCCPEGAYYLLKVTRLIQPLDLPNSLVSWAEGLYSPYLRSVSIFSFQEALLEGVHIFAIPEFLEGYFITDALKERIEASSLRSNLQATLVWDSQNPEYFDERYRNRPEQWARAKHELLIQKGLVEPPPPPPPPPPRQVVEEALTEQDRQDMLNILQAAVKRINRAERLKLQLGTEPKLLVQQVFFQCEKQRRRRDLPQEEQEKLAIELGLLWGEQVCRAHGWHWAKVDEVDDFAVVAPDGSAYVTPAFYMFGFFHDPDQENTTLLLFNMIGAKGKIPAGPGAYLRLG